MAVTSDAEFLKILEQAYEEAWEIVNSEDGWKKEAEEKGTLTNFHFFLSVQIWYFVTKIVLTYWEKKLF